MKLIPKGLHDKVILKPTEANDRTLSGFIIPDTGKEKSQLAEVVSTGKGMYNFFHQTWVAPEVKVGDLVLVPKFNASSFKVDGVDYYACKETELLSVISKIED